MFLSGAIAPVRHPRLGFMHTPMMGNRIQRGVWWGCDTGMFAAPERFTLGGYLTWLERQEAHRLRNLFATAPDVVGDAEATLAVALPVLPRLRAMGYRAALCAQNGLERLPVPWDAFDVLFVGGDDAFKLGPAWGLAEEARRRGKWTHLGRCNSFRRLKAAASAGYDSADGTFAAFGPDANWPRLIGWLDALGRQPLLEAA